MAKLNWNKQTDIDKQLEDNAAEQAKRDKFKDKKFATLSSKEKDVLLELLARQAGLL